MLSMNQSFGSLRTKKLKFQIKIWMNFTMCGWIFKGMINGCKVSSKISYIQLFL